MSNMPTFENPCGAYSRYEITKAIPLDRLQKICHAQQDGRLVVLPCKVGDTVYMVQQVGSGHWEQDKYILDDEGTPKVYEKKFNLMFLDYIGKSVFLSRAEAEATLKSANTTQTM